MINVMDNEQELKKNTDNRKTLVHFLQKYPGIWFSSLFLIPIGVTIFAYYQLSYTDYVPQPQAKTPFIPVQSTVSTFADSSNPIPGWLILAVIFCCGSGSFMIFYLLQNSKYIQRGSQRHRYSQKFNSQKRHKSPNFPSPPSNRENLLIILPPEKIYPLNTHREFFTDLLNISQHISQQRDSRFF
ncbi:hypothetical protein [Cuspidothrix issatschenkoi]|nr:hypothetical protein [Cuspidothrix issatschenkoi]